MANMRAAWLDRPWVTALFGLVAAILTWAAAPMVPGPGLDGSWITGLNMAAAAGLDHGTEVVYTYGPLGFLEVPLAIDGTLAAIGAIYLLALRAALAATLLHAARGSLPWPAAAAVALVAAAVTPGSLVPLSLAAVWCLIALQGESRGGAGEVVALGGGALAGIELMVKLNVGITIALLVVATVAVLPARRARRLGMLAGAALVTFAIGWFASGQGLGNLDDYARSSFETVSGYSDALQRDDARLSWDWAAALALGLLAVGAAFAASAGMRASRRAAIVAVVVVLALALEKYSFVRHDAGHVGAYFGGICAVLVALRWHGAGRFVLAGAVAATAALYGAASGAWDEHSPLRPGLAADQLTTLLIPGERRDAVEEGRASLRRIYDLDPSILERIGDEPVDARPWETALVWAYELDWRPLPVLQDYQAYTPWLDELDAEALASADGPRLILRHLGFSDQPYIGLEGRFEPFSSPLVTRGLLCRFRPAMTTDRYQLLERAGDRCGPPRDLGSASTGYGEPVAVPDARPDEAVFARIEGASASGIERLRALLYRAAVRRIGLDDSSAFLAPRNAEQGLLLTAPAGTGYEAPWILAFNPREVAIESAGGFATSEGEVRIEFFAVPLRRASVPLD